MKTFYVWTLTIIILILIIVKIKWISIYEMFDSRPKVYYIWRSGDDISGKFSPQWNLLKERIKANNLNIKMCDVDTSKEPDLDRYEKSKQAYRSIPLVRLVSSKGNRYDYNIMDDYKYYYGSRSIEDLREYLKEGLGKGDISGFLASNKIYKMIVQNYNK